MAWCTRTPAGATKRWRRSSGSSGAQSEGYGMGYEIAVIYAALGDKEKGCAALLTFAHRPFAVDRLDEAGPAHGSAA